MEVNGTKQTLTWKLRNVRIKGEADIPVIARRRPLLAQAGLRGRSQTTGARKQPVICRVWGAEEAKSRIALVIASQCDKFSDALFETYPGRPIQLLHEPR